ncbi:heparinase II/III domain-containing protein [Paenibacillus illinoisensis]|uniref:heparinase II/III domain-containing protein n=1 Tax=Paenibacillus illinoisensis TaxID=59845 RepID=UPI003D27E706
MTANSGYRIRLQELIIRAQHLLETRGSFVTDGAQLALKDVLNQACMALNGNGEVPFLRNREFLVPREEESIRFATKRYTMVPPFNEEGKVYAEYGLEPAIEWFERQDMLHEGVSAIPTKAKFALKKAHELLGDATLGDSAGNYGHDEANRLKQAMHLLAVDLREYGPEGGGEATARKVVDVFNRMREFRHSRRLLTDLDPGACLYLTAEGMNQLRADVLNDPQIKEWYAEIERWTELYSLDQLETAVGGFMKERADYEELNRYFYVWSHTDKIVNFTVPSRAVQATLSFILPAEENEQHGLGHIWVDDVNILTASGGSLDILNGGFDDGEDRPDHWFPHARRGKPNFKWESEYPYSGGGNVKDVRPSNPSEYAFGEQGRKRSIYICNPTSEDEGAWVYDGTFAVKEGTKCTLTFSAKLDGKLQKGIRAMISFMDGKGQHVDEFVYYFNRKSSLPGGRLQLAMQCDAIRYGITGDKLYAMKAKLAMLYILNDFCQGAEHWLVTNLRPEGSDGYGAVQGGRLLSVLAVSYSLIRQADVFDVHEKGQFYELIEYMLRYMLDLRDRTEWSAEEAQRGCSNWQTDMCVGTGFLMMALSDFPNRHVWLNNASAVLRAQLTLNVNADGSWPESIRYHHAALERFAGYAMALKNVMGEDWFSTMPLVRMFGYGVDMQTPGYAYFDGRISTPPFGDHALGGGEEFGYYAVFHANVAATDQRLADRIYHTWTAAGRPVKKLHGEGVAFENLLTQVQRYIPTEALRLESSAAYPDAGIYIFRKEFNCSKQSYFAIMSSLRPIAHGHLDQGSFILYKNSVPLVMDSGIEGYFDSSTQWHLSSYSHACLQFATRQNSIPIDSGNKINLSAGTFSLEKGWVDVPKCSRVLDVHLGGDVESITIEIANPEGAGRHIRHVAYVRKPDVYIIRDDISDFEGKVLFNLPVAATESWKNGNRIFSRGAFGVDLETTFLSCVESIELEQGRTTRFYPRENDGASMMDYVRAVADASEGFLTVLYPKEKGNKELTVTHRSDGTISLETEEAHVLLDMPTWRGVSSARVDQAFRLVVSPPINVHYNEKRK